MASDRRQFERAYAHWQTLKSQECLSVPDDDGIVAILASDFPFYLKHSGEEDAVQDEQDHWDFRNEADDYADRLGDIGVLSEVIYNADADDLTDAIQDEEVSSIVVIGHGSISDILLRGKKYGLYDWRDVACATTHLKTGAFVQRQCGIFRRNINVPLGLFAVRDFSQVQAATGQLFDPVISPESNENIQQTIPTGLQLSYDSLKQYLSIQNPLFA